MAGYGDLQLAIIETVDLEYEIESTEPLERDSRWVFDQLSASLAPDRAGFRDVHSESLRERPRR